MPNEAPAAIPATPGNFGDRIAANVAAAPAPAPAAPAAAPPAPPAARMPHPGATAPATAATQPADPMAAILPTTPANDNAQLTPDPALELITGQAPAEPAEAAPDPWAEEIHGVTARDFVESLKRGELPSQALEHLQIPVKPNGQEMMVSAREAANGYMRLSDYTRDKMAVADRERAIEADKAKLAKLFAGWDKPEGFEQGAQAMGLVPQVRAMITKNWAGSDGKPNVNAFMDDMRRLGHYGTFRAAVKAYADAYAQRMDMLNPEGKAELAERAHQMFERDEEGQAALWAERLKAESETDRLRQEAWKRDRANMLAQRQQQQQQPDNTQQRLQHIHDWKTQAFTLAGIPAGKAADDYFQDAFIQQAEIAQRNREQVNDSILVRRAIQQMVEQIDDQRRRAGAPPLKPQQRAAVAAAVAAAPAQPPTAPALPARAAAAPTTAPSSLPRGGNVSAFQERLQAITNAGKR